MSYDNCIDLRGQNVHIEIDGEPVRPVTDTRYRRPDGERSVSDNQPSSPRADPSTVWAVVVLGLGLMALIGWVAWLILS